MSTIALDAMGGDHAPQVVIAGADMARQRFPELSFLLYGDGPSLRSLLQTRPLLAARCEIEHTPERVDADARPRMSCAGARHEHGPGDRGGEVRSGERHGLAGNTGALMALAKFMLKTLPGIDRPAIAALTPTRRSETVFLDLGANAECDADNLVQFAVMGRCTPARCSGSPSPRSVC